MIDVFLKDKSSVRFLSEDIREYASNGDGKSLTIDLKPNRTYQNGRVATLSNDNFSRAIVSTGCRVSEYRHWEDFFDFMEFFKEEENRDQEYCF